MARKVYTYSWPTGTGKTRAILHRVIASEGFDALDRTLISCPSQKARKVWTREILLTVDTRRLGKLRDFSGKTREQMEKMIHRASYEKHREWLAQSGLKIPVHIITHRRLGKMRNRGKSWFHTLVIDEWHRVSFAHRQKAYWQYQYDPRKAWQDQPKKLASHSRSYHWTFDASLSLRVFLASATPVNPVHEHEEETSDAEFELSIKKKKFEMLLFARALEGAPRISTSAAQSWPHPKAPPAGVYKPPFTASWLTREESFETLEEAPEITRLIKNRASFKEEYAYCTLVHKTRYDRTRQIWVSGGSKKLFCAQRYAVFHRAEDPHSFVAEHPRMKLLVNLLLLRGALERTTTGFKLGSEKCLIFCSQWGTARMLHSYLFSHLSEEDSRRVHTTTRKLKKQRQIERLFRADPAAGKDHSMILITTDAYSESLDLHDHCRHLIHFELPWSPLRLMQRVGRLTRRKGAEFNCPLIDHVIVPGSVEEERINRLFRRFRHLHQENLLPKHDWKEFALKMIGAGPSLHLAESLSSSALASSPSHF